MMQAFTKTTSPLKGEASQWWALSDLNGRPFGCKPNALTAELSAQPILCSSYRKRREASTHRRERLILAGKFVFSRRIDCRIAQQSAAADAAKGVSFRRNSRGSLHFVRGASKLVFLLIRKGNAQRC